MDAPKLITSTEKELLVIDNWPMNLEATREQLNKVQKRLERYRTALRLASVEIERRNQGIMALTTFVYQASRVASPTALLKLTLVQATETVSVSMGAIVLIDPETKELTLGVHKGLSTELYNILSGQHLGAGATVLMPHLVTGAGALLECHSTDDETERLLLTTSHLTSLVSLPIQLGSRLMGALLIGRQSKKPFTSAELCFLMALSQETAAALESLRLREGVWHTAETLLGGATPGVDLQKAGETELTLDVSTPFDLPDPAPTIPQPTEDDLEQLLAAMMEAEDEMQQHNADFQTLNTVAEMMNRTLNLKEILQAAVEQTKATLHTDAAWLYLMNDKKQLEMKAHVGLSSDYVIGMQRLKHSVGLEGRVAAGNKAQFVETVSKDPHPHKIWVDKERLHALAAVPITRPDETPAEQGSSHVVGVLATGIRDVQSHLWSPREVRLLTSIANQVAPAIDNARLHAQVQEHETEMRAGNEILRTINDMLLEKNTFFEGFIQDELAPALTAASQALQQAMIETPTTPTDGQKQHLTTLQKIVDQLTEQVRETSLVNTALDTEFDRVLDREDNQHGYAGSTRPLRLEKKRDNEPDPISSAKINDAPSEPENSAGNDQSSTKLLGSAENDHAPPEPLSYEDAVAAGLVPAHILNREKD